MKLNKLPLDTWVNLCYSLLEGSNPTEGNCTMTTIVVTEVAELEGRDVPVEAIVFQEKSVTYSRLLVPPTSVAPLLAAGFDISELHFTAVLS